jgi:hypothetical protein
MDEDLADLVRQLLTRAGMIMEDASAIAIQIGHKNPNELGSICGSLRAHNRDVGALLAAAGTLIKPDFPGS